ncbi:MAG TPA: hypothetical protein VGT43_05480 [Burkholderiales bacterium]|nr:hypothetical protein [Burkholderiales bacterium]
MRYTVHTLLGMAVIAAATAAGAAEGDIPDHPALTAKWYFGAGLFIPKTTTEARLTSSTLGAGAIIDFEDSLGMDDEKEVPGFMARWRINHRWRVEAEYFELKRSATRGTNREIQWGDQVFPINTQVSSEFNFSDLRVSVGYSFFRTKDKELGAGIGFHVASYEASLRTASLGSDSEDVTAPLPVLTMYGQFALTDRWAVSARLDRLSLDYDKYEGSIGAVGVDLMYQPFRNFGFGIGFRSLLFDLKVEENSRQLEVRQTFQGPILFLTGSF